MRVNALTSILPAPGLRELPAKCSPEILWREPGLRFPTVLDPVKSVPLPVKVQRFFYAMGVGLLRRSDGI